MSRCPLCGADRDSPVLTPRQLEALVLVSKGYEDKQIARLLGISQASVRHRLSAAYTRLDARCRTHAVVRAYVRGLITL